MSGYSFSAPSVAKPKADGITVHGATVDVTVVVEGCGQVALVLAQPAVHLATLTGQFLILLYLLFILMLL